MQQSRDFEAAGFLPLLSFRNANVKAVPCHRWLICIMILPIAPKAPFTFAVLAVLPRLSLQTTARKACRPERWQRLFWATSFACCGILQLPKPHRVSGAIENQWHPNLPLAVAVLIAAILSEIPKHQMLMEPKGNETAFLNPWTAARAVKANLSNGGKSSGIGMGV